MKRPTANRVALTGLRPSGLPHHPAYGSVPGGSSQPAAAGFESAPECRWIQIGLCAWPHPIARALQTLARHKGWGDGRHAGPGGRAASGVRPVHRRFGCGPWRHHHSTALPTQKAALKRTHSKRWRAMLCASSAPRPRAPLVCGSCSSACGSCRVCFPRAGRPDRLDFGWCLQVHCCSCLVCTQGT